MMWTPEFVAIRTEAGRLFCVTYGEFYSRCVAIRKAVIHDA